MHINAHAHIFTLQTVLTREAIRIVGQRLRDRNFRNFIVDAVENLLDDQLDRPAYLTEEELLKQFLRRIAETRAFKDFLRENTASLPFEIQVLGDGIEGLGVMALRASLDRLSTFIDQRDGPRTSPFDIFETLRLAMHPDITSVADRLLEHLDADDALVALMMDIRARDEIERDRRNFRRQLEGTTEAVLQRPGRVLPFVAVNPGRPEHFDVMKDAIEQRGFVGVKLYPSLGFEVTTPEMMRVMAYCAEHEVPVLSHCSHGGFYADEDFIDFCDPAPWEAVLDAHPDLYVCFAHFGGWESLGKPDGLNLNTWGGKILDLMRGFPHVFTDLSYHVDMMKAPEDERRYFERLRGLLADPLVGGRILFGTDSWLLRLSISDAHYWAYFRSKLTDDEFRQIADLGPRRFIGLPHPPNVGIRQNMGRYVDFLKASRQAVGADPPLWLRKAAGVDFTVGREGSLWNKDRHAARIVFAYFKPLMPSAVRRRGFKNSPDVRLRQLQYWREGHEPESLFRQRYTAHARDVVAFAKRNGGRYEGTYTDTSAVEHMIGILSDGDRRLVEVANSLDFILRFSNEA